MGDPYHFLKKQAVAAALGICLLLGAARLNYRLWKVLAIPLLVVSAALLPVFVPGMRQEIGGSARWLKISSFSFQPAELAKLALVIYLARSLTNKEGRMESFAVGFLPHIVMGILFVLVLKQPDFGTGILFVSVVFLMLFAAGASLAFRGDGVGRAAGFALSCGPGEIPAGAAVTFLDPWSDPGNAGFQIIQSFLAFGSGNVFGVGLGVGKQKLFYLPEVHTDFIFSVIGEELGLIGVAVVVGLFAALIFRRFRASFRAPDLFGTYFALGITCLLSIQTLLNMGVVMGLLPTKGSTLPFISYGGTSLFMNLLAVGILLNISSQGIRKRNENINRRRRDGGHLFPALALAEAFKERDPRNEILFVGSRRGLEGSLVEKEGYALKTIDLASLKGKRVFEKIRALFVVPRSLIQAAGVLRAFRPDWVVGVGGYASGPVVLAAWALGYKTFLQEQNVFPGLSNRILGRLVDRAFISFAESAGHFPAGQAVLTGNPVRRRIRAGKGRPPRTSSRS